MTGKLIRIIKNWDFPNLLRQTPGWSGRWGEYQFTLDPVESCDYAIILNQPAEPVSFLCPPKNIWAMMQEPPNEYHGWLHSGQDAFARIYTTDEDLKGKKFIKSQPVLPWHINKDYDFLKNCNPPEKNRNLSWINSNLLAYEGHKHRLDFLEKLRNSSIKFDLYGKGFNYIEDKWDGLAPYQYALAVENFSNPYYWSEKLADCFLSWCMPVYYGCTRITEYFPAESMIIVDINSPDSIEKIRESIKTDLWKKNREAIAEARQRILEQYQLFPFFAREINADPNFIQTTRRQLIKPRNRPIPPKPIRERIAGFIQNVHLRIKSFGIYKIWMKVYYRLRSIKNYLSKTKFQ